MGSTGDHAEEKNRVLVLGGGNAERNANGWTTKSAIARYLHDLADRIGGTTWLVQQSGTWGVALENESHGLEGELDPNRVDVVPFDYRLSRAPVLWRQLLGLAPLHRYGVFFLPATVPFVPVLRLATRQLDRSAAYLAGDYIDRASEMSEDAWMGWATLQKLAHIGTLKACDLTIARGHKLASVASRYSKEVVETIPLANIDFGAAPRSANEESVPGRLLFIGVVAESKGIHILLDAMLALEERGREVSLEVCGDGPDLEAAKSQARASGLEERGRVVFRGWVDDAQVLARAFAETKVLVMPSTTHPEGVPRVIDEAIARSVPVVATASGGVAEEFTQGEITVVPPSDLGALTDALESALFDEEVRGRLTRASASRREWLLESGTAGAQHASLLSG